MLNDLIKIYSQKNAEKVDYYPVTHRDSEIHAEQSGNLERHEVSKIVDLVQSKMCFRSQEVGRIISRFIMYVLGVHK